MHKIQIRRDAGNHGVPEREAKQAVGCDAAKANKSRSGAPENIKRESVPGRQSLDGKISEVESDLLEASEEMRKLFVERCIWRR